MGEIERRKNAALTAIKNVLSTKEDKYGVTLFVSHHLAEIEKHYWQANLGSTSPEPEQVLDILVLQSHWGDENSDGMDCLDFTLPGNITNYLLSVSFDAAGDVAEITMES